MVIVLLMLQPEKNANIKCGKANMEDNRYPQLAVLACALQFSEKSRVKLGEILADEIM